MPMPPTNYRCTSDAALCVKTEAGAAVYLLDNLKLVFSREECCVPFLPARAQKQHSAHIRRLLGRKDQAAAPPGPRIFVGWLRLRLGCGRCVRTTICTYVRFLLSLPQKAIVVLGVLFWKEKKRSAAEFFASKKIQFSCLPYIKRPRGCLGCRLSASHFFRRPDRQNG